MKKCILLSICFCCIADVFSQQNIDDYIKVVGVDYIDNAILFNYYHKPTPQRKLISVCKFKQKSLITDSLYLNKLQEKISLKGDVFMDSALFDSNCFVYQSYPYDFVAEYIFPCIKDTQYVDTIKKTYYKYGANPSVKWGKAQRIKSFSITRMYHRKFLIVEMSVGFYNEYGKIWNPQRYRYSEKPEDAHRRFRFAIPLKEDE